MASGFDARRAHLGRPDMFGRFRVPDRGIPLSKAGCDPGDWLIVFERRGLSRALHATQMTYHHVAQGELAGEPYLVTF